MSKENIMTKISEMPSKRKKTVIPRRLPSIAVLQRKIVYTSPDKTVCVDCPCYPKEDPYVRNKKLNPCQKSPLSLYELSANVVDSMPLAKVFDWSESDVARWLIEDVGLPQYQQCIYNNHINGKRLLMLDDPSKLSDINVQDFGHIQIITSKVRELFGTDAIRFTRSVSLPARRPLTSCAIFKSRTGPTWGVRNNWARCDILRWMKIIMPKPKLLDHWEIVWYQKPDFPKIKFGRIKRSPITSSYIPHYKEQPEVCREYLIPRKFVIQKDIPEDQQYIWMEHLPEPNPKAVPKEPKIWKSRLASEKISLTGLSGKEFILAKRKMATPKFFP